MRRGVLIPIAKPNDPAQVAMEVAKAGENPEVVLEAIYRYYWLVDLLQDGSANVGLTHATGLKWEGRRVKTTR